MGALSARDTATAERAAHSLKGAAGTLGGAALSEAAAKTEAAIRTGQPVHAELAALSSSLDGVVAAIKAALPDEIVTNNTRFASVDPATVIMLLSRLKHLLESDDGEAADFIVDAQPRLVGVLTTTELETLSGLVGDFDFEASLKCLAGIANRLELHLESR
jgi:two-component system sensor histidine kinase/response regulator